MKFTKLLSCAVAAAMCMALVSGCGGEKKQEVVKIGLLAPLTGGNSALGIGMKNSGQLAVDQANKSGKYPYKFELVVADDAGDPSTAVAAMNKLIADKSISAITGHFNSGCALATAPIAHKAGVPFVVTGAIHPGITEKGYKEITRVITSADIQNKYAGELAATKWGVKTIALINDRTDYGKTNAEQFGKAAEANGAKVISVDGITVGQQDFAALLTKIKATNPDCIYFGGVATEAGLLKRQMNDLQINALFLSDSGIISDTFNKIAGPAASGMIAFNIGKPLEDLAGGKKFLEDYSKANFKEPAENIGPFTYDSVGLIIKTIGESKETKRSKLIQLIHDAVYEGVLGTTSFDTNGNTKNDLITTYISEDGKWIPYDKASVIVRDKKIIKK